MKIAYVHDGPVPSKSANSVHVMKMCTALAKEGADVTLYCPYSDEIKTDDPYSMYGVERCFKIIQVKPSFIFRKVPSLDNISIAWKIAKIVSKQQYEYVFGRSMWSLFFLKDIPFIFETHMLPMKKRMFAEQNLFSRATLLKVVMITKGLKEDYLNVFPKLSPEKIVVLQDAADIAKQVDANSTPIDTSKLLSITQKPVIGYLGHLYPGKCMEILSQIAAKRPNYEFHVVGGKDEWVEKWKKDERCKNLTNIKFYGYVDNKTIPYYYSLFDICVLPFSSNIIVGKMKNADIARWTSPLKLFEAMSYGKPILATNLGTIQEVLTNGDNCLLESPTNIEGWCSKLDRLVLTQGLRDEMGTKAKRLFEEKYTWSKRAQEIIKIMKS